MRVPAIAALLTIVLAGCGGAAKRGGASSDARAVKATLAMLVAATANKDYATLCNRVLSPALVSHVTQLGLPCTIALARGLGNVIAPQLVIRSVQIKGQTALARVHTGAANQGASDDTVELQKVGGHWFVSSLLAATAKR